jgi:3-dehydroquinate synthase
MSGYKTTHGNAVTAGMAIITRTAAKMGICGEDCRQDVLSMLKRYDMPVNTDYDAASLARACLADKKRDGGKLTMIFPEKIGKCVLKDIKVEELENLIRLGLEEQK